MLIICPSFSEFSLYLLIFPLLLWHSHIIAQTNKIFHLIFRHTSVQTNADPLILIHMVSRMKPWLCTQRADQNRLTFYIDHICQALPWQPQLIPTYP